MTAAKKPTEPWKVKALAMCDQFDELVAMLYADPDCLLKATQLKVEDCLAISKDLLIYMKGLEKK